MGVVSKSAFYLLFTMMCINVFSGMLNHVGIVGVPIQAIEWDEAALNPDLIINSTSQSELSWFDTGYGLSTFWYTCVPLIEQFPAMMKAYGVAEFIYKPIHNIWRLMWTVTITIVIIAGRDV